MQNVQIDNHNTIYLSWQPVIDSLNIFSSYQLYYATSLNGPFVMLDSITDINQNFYIDTTLYNNSNLYFFIKTAYGCNNNFNTFLSQASNTLYLNSVGIKNMDKNKPELLHSLYPNPSDKICVFEFEEALLKDISFSLYDYKGVLLYKNEKVNGKKFYLNHESFQDGLYFYRFYNPESGATVNGKLIIIK